MGVVVIGPSGSGKSTIWNLLRLALGKVGQTVKHYTMNPKAMPRTQVRVCLSVLVSCDLGDVEVPRLESKNL